MKHSHYIIIVVIVLMALALPCQAVPKPGDVDLSFNPGSTLNGTVYAITLQTNGQPVMTGSFSQGWVRLQTNGQNDSSFHGNPGGSFAVAIQSDGKIITEYGGIVRLNNDGSLDSDFQIADFGGGDTIYSIVIQPDGKILISGQFDTVNGAGHVNFARLNSDGSLDAGFQGGTRHRDFIYSIALQPDGKVIIAGDFSAADNIDRHHLARLNANGSLDTSFQDSMSDNSIQSVIPQPDGKVLIAGYFNSVGGAARHGIARLNSDGSLDATFQNGMAGTSGSINYAAYSMALQPDGKVLICGGFDHVNNVSRHGIVRLNSDGSLDTTFQDGMAGADFHGVGYSDVECVTLQPDGKVLIGGLFDSINGVTRHFVARLYGLYHEPTITLQPKSQAVLPGSDMTFNITAEGDPTLLYQWFKNSTNLIEGATNLSLTLTNVTKSAEGFYSVTVSNSLGWVGSSNAALRVNLPPTADASATQPLVISDDGFYGNVTLDGSLSSDPDGDPLQYDWDLPYFFHATGQHVTVPLRAGVFPIQLTVSDGAVVATNIVIVTVKVPPAFSNFGFSGGQFGFEINGELNGIVVEASTNLLDWIPLSTNLVAEYFPINFSDPDSTNFPNRFYRARVQ